MISDVQAQRLIADLREQGGPRPFADMVLRTRSRQGMDFLAYGASHSTLDYNSLIELITSSTAAELPIAARHFDADWLLQVARVAVLSPSQPDKHAGLRDADALFEFIRAGHGVEAFDEDSCALYGQVLMRLRSFDRLAGSLHDLKLAESYRWSLTLDSMNPFIGASNDYTNWLHQLNTIFTAAHNEPIALRDVAGTPFDRLTSRASIHHDDSLVTVIMPTFKPGPSLVTAVNSVTNQSWSNIELLIVDDASPPEYRDVLENIASPDKRIRVIYARSNGGAYRARNLGLEEARGEYVTFQDSDDWSHPRRVERQVEQLRQDQRLLAVRSWAVRALPDLTFTCVGYPPNRPNMSSLLFRREAVLERIGFFDTARKSADAEFEARLHASVPDSLLTMPEATPLSIIRLGQDSLSRAELLPSWSHWSRLAYRDAYKLWHSQIRRGLVSPRLGARAALRQFPLPEPSWSRNPQLVPANTRYDILVLNDWRRGHGHQLELIRDIKAMLAAGLKVAVAHAEAPTPVAHQRQLQSTSIQKLINERLVHFVHIEQRFHSDLTLVCNPAALQFLPGVRPRATTNRLVVLAQTADGAGRNAAVPYDIETCTVNAEELFERAALWVPRDPDARRYLTERLPTDQVADVDLPISFDPARWRTARRRPSRFRPIIGRPAIDSWCHYPASKEELLDAYPDNDRFDVRMLGGTVTARAILGESLPPNWVSFAENHLSRRSYLAQLDFFVYFHHPMLEEPAGVTILEAMASGCVVVLPPHLIGSYGDAAMYCKPREVAGVVLDMHASARDFNEQRHRGMKRAERERAVFVNLIITLLSS